jgi:hypothetical protein
MNLDITAWSNSSFKLIEGLIQTNASISELLELVIKGGARYEIENLYDKFTEGENLKQTAEKTLTLLNKLLFNRENTDLGKRVKLGIRYIQALANKRISMAAGPRDSRQLDFPFEPTSADEKIRSQQMLKRDMVNNLIEFLGKNRHSSWVKAVTGLDILPTDQLDTFFSYIVEELDNPQSTLSDLLTNKAKEIQSILKHIPGKDRLSGQTILTTDPYNWVFAFAHNTLSDLKALKPVKREASILLERITEMGEAVQTKLPWKFDGRIYQLTRNLVRMLLGSATFSHLMDNSRKVVDSSDGAMQKFLIRYLRPEQVVLLQTDPESLFQDSLGNVYKPEEAHGVIKRDGISQLATAYINLHSFGLIKLIPGTMYSSTEREKEGVSYTPTPVTEKSYVMPVMPVPRGKTEIKSPLWETYEVDWNGFDELKAKNILLPEDKLKIVEIELAIKKGYLVKPKSFTSNAVS